MNYTTVNIQDEQQTRHEFLYGLQTMAVLFRNIRHKGFMSDSREGKVILRFSHECSSAKDFLSYLLAVHETGQVMLQHGDVIGIKINGSIICYRYTEQGHTNKDLLISEVLAVSIQKMIDAKQMDNTKESIENVLCKESTLHFIVSRMPNVSPVPAEVMNDVVSYFEHSSGLANYKPVEICRVSNDPEDSHLYAVIGYNLEK